MPSRHPLVLFLVGRIERASWVATGMLLTTVALVATARLRTPFHPIPPLVGALEIVSLLMGIPVSMMVQPISKAIEAGSPRVRTLRQAWGCVLVLGAGGLVAVVAALGGAHDPLVGARNAMISCGVALLTAASLGARVSWIPPLSLSLIILRYGMDFENTPYDWALPLAAGNEPASWQAAIVLTVAGVWAYGRWDIRETEV